jgi:hypothetical protein
MMIITLATATALTAARYRCNMEFPRLINFHLVEFVSIRSPLFLRCRFGGPGLFANRGVGLMGPNPHAGYQWFSYHKPLMYLVYCVSLPLIGNC